MDLLLSLMWAFLLCTFSLWEEIFIHTFFFHNDINGIKNEYLVITDMAGIEGRSRIQI